MSRTVRGGLVAVLGALAFGLAVPGSALGHGELAAEAQVRIADGTASSGWRDFVLHRDAMMLMQGTLNGIPATIMIDSGVSAVIVDSTFAKRAGLGSEAAVTIHSVAGRTSGSRVSGLDVAIPGLALSGRPGFIADLSPVHRVAGAKFDVMLGRDVFDAFMVDIDFPSSKIAFHDPKRFRPPANAVSLPLKQEKRSELRSIPLMLEGKPVLATFDLGARAALLLSPKYAAEHKLPSGGRRSTAPSTGVDGTTVSAIGTLADVELGGVIQRQVPVTIPQAWQNDRRNIAVPATIGMGLLSRFRIISDYSSDRLWLVPDAEALAREFRKDRSGLYTVKSGGTLKVVHVSLGSPAAAAGWREGDEIVAVNGAAIAEDFYKGELHRWSDGPAGSRVELRLANGSVRALTLQDYY